MSIKIYVEGGGDSKSLQTRCRKGFRIFLERAGFAGRMPAIVACGGRQNAYERFKTSLSATDGTPLLLVDAEAPVSAPGSWNHLKTRDGWDRPDGSADDQCHLMAQIMESWFLADKKALASFYGQGFRPNAISGNAQVEAVPKADVLSGLERATKDTKKGAYRKGSHSFEILASLDADAVEGAAPHAKRFLDTLRAGED